MLRAIQRDRERNVILIIKTVWTERPLLSHAIYTQHVYPIKTNVSCPDAAGHREFNHNTHSTLDWTKSNTHFQDLMLQNIRLILLYFCLDFIGFAIHHHTWQEKNMMTALDGYSKTLIFQVSKALCYFSSYKLQKRVCNKSLHC